MPVALAAGTALTSAKNNVSRVLPKDLYHEIKPTIAVIGRVKTNSVETLVPALDGLEILLPVGLPLAGTISPVGANAETLVSPGQCLTRHHESHREGAKSAEELHSELKKMRTD